MCESYERERLPRRPIATIAPMVMSISGVGSGMGKLPGEIAWARAIIGIDIASTRMETAIACTITLARTRGL